MSLTQKIGQVITLSTLIFGSFIPTAFSATVPQENAQETKSETLLAQSTVRKNTFRFQMNNCRRINREVVCSVLVTNISNSSRRFTTYKISGEAVDFSGNIYPFSKAAIGKKYTTNKFGVRISTTPGIPIKVNYYMTIPQGINELAGIQFQTGNYGKVGFRNIPIGNYRRVRGRHNCQ